MRMFTPRRHPKVGRIAAVALIASITPYLSPAAPLAAQNSHAEGPPPPDARELTPDPAIYGRWQTVIPEEGGAAIERVLGMQTVHAVLLPSGKVLWASGSSWRNHAPIEHYPNVRNPAPGTGVFNRNGNPFAMDSLEKYYQLVNNVAVYDPDRNTFYRIPHPVPVADPDSAGQFAPSDLFCTGHLHLPDGNVLFTGGTQYYYPYRTGNRSTYIFDWKKELGIDWQRFDWRRMPDEQHDPWIFSGFMKRGRWYASIVPLLDGRMAVFSGFVGFQNRYPEMYEFEINHTVDFFNPAGFDRRNPDAAWRNVDVRDTPNSPFATVINPDFVPDDNVQCDERCIRANQRDAFKLYPENYLMPDGRIYLTREGDWVSLRTESTAFMRRTTHTYWATLGGTPNAPTVSFQRGPERPDTITSYGTTYLDPNTGNITLLGGQPTSPGTLLPMNVTVDDNIMPPTHFAGGRGSRKRQEFITSPNEPFGGHWTLEENFLGNEPQDDRTMHYAIILPNRQVLVINGGNYDFYGPVFYPLLLTPRFDGGRFIGYHRQRMVDGVEPRLYHNNALLLPDGRILISGGNSARATVRSDADPGHAHASTGQPKPDLGLVDVDMYFFGDGPMARGQKGQLTTPTEDWVAEIYSPPYLFIDPDRRAAVTSIAPVTPPTSYQPEAVIGGKTFNLLHSNADYRVQLTGLPASCPAGRQGTVVLEKLSSATHGWQNGQQFYDLRITSSDANGLVFRTPDARAANLPPAYYMLFYVDCRGKPAVARMVRFDDQATEP
ncbi:MAG TPA: galactose oxidase-like domain-containing protein [Longimicrobium sp.]|nr:galactose oxidase-like domain-containing protein [Longimicrobium sp.]